MDDVFCDMRPPYVPKILPTQGTCRSSWLFFPATHLRTRQKTSSSQAKQQAFDVSVKTALYPGYLKEPSLALKEKENIQGSTAHPYRPARPDSWQLAGLVMVQVEG